MCQAGGPPCGKVSPIQRSEVENEPVDGPFAAVERLQQALAEPEIRQEEALESLCSRIETAVLPPVGEDF